MTGKIAARDVRALLRKRFDPNRYSVMEEVGDATGAMQTRRLDMVVVSSWPSDGYTIEGIEIKVSKSDLKHELENPQKHNVFFGDIDFFSLAAPREVITMSLIPGKWGVYEVYEDGKGELKLKCKRKPIALSDEPKRGVSLPFFASIVRNLHAESPSNKLIRDAERRGYEKGRGEAVRGWELKSAYEQIKRQNKELAAFRAHYFIDGRFPGITLEDRAKKMAAMDRLMSTPSTVAEMRILSNELGKMADLIEGELC